MEERKEPKLAHRLIPCPQYDVSGMECWLEHMAKQGLLCGMADGNEYTGMLCSNCTYLWGRNVLECGTACPRVG